jgi:serine protease
MQRFPVALIVTLSLLIPQSASLRAASSLRTFRRVPAPAASYRPGELIVKFATATSESLAEHAIREAGGLRARRSAYGQHYLVSLDAGVSVQDALARFQSMREVEYAEPNGIVRASFAPDDPFFRFQWNFRMIGAQRTWDIQKGKSDVAVAVLDTGIAYEDFGPYRKAPDWGNVSFLQGFDFVNGDSHANDDDAHGTHVASTIAEATNNGEGVAGLAFNCSLMPVKVLNAQGNGSFFDVAEGVDYAANFVQNGQHPVKVINMSLGGSSASETLRRAIDRAFAQGIVLVAAAGNESIGVVDFPAAFANVIGVGAVDERKQKAGYSNFGSALDVVAPGGDIDHRDASDEPFGILQQTFDPQTAAFEGRYDDFAYFYFDGTSQATPHVAALAALLVSQGITDPAAVRAAIEQTADDLGAPGRDDMYGHGLINPANALSGLGLSR